MKKNIFKYIVLSVIMTIILITNVHAAEEFYFCNTDSIKAFKFIGNIIYVVKIVAPLCIIIMASIDFFRAIMSNDEKALSVSSKAFIRRLIAGILIFFIPTIVDALLNFISPAIGDTKFDEYIICTQCLFDPFDCETDELQDLNDINDTNDTNQSDSIENSEKEDKHYYYEINSSKKGEDEQNNSDIPKWNGGAK